MTGTNCILSRSIGRTIANALFLMFTGAITNCNTSTNHQLIPFEISDPELTMELIATSPAIQTPIGLAIDANDDLFVLESHTHTPPDDYQGPDHDRIKKGIDKNKDGVPEQWVIYADSLEDGMNLVFGPEQTLFLSTKNKVWAFKDENDDGISDQRTLLLKMVEPQSPYDHAAILGVAVSPDNQWLFVSRGNTGSNYWKIIGTDDSSISGYGDGGNVMRCRLDGSDLEEVATGFWNPFDLKFTADGRLMMTDNDPDSRGPNRLIELVPGGDYGYKSLYGGSGIHPFLSWNGELPGTLPYAAPLGEAACALLDGSLTGFGVKYQNTVLVNIWEEKNLVKVPLQSRNSSVTGAPEVLVQGDSTFHPVALAANSKGQVYITDWVVRQYPNHGNGKIWRLSSKQLVTPNTVKSSSNYRFNTGSKTKAELSNDLTSGDPFLKAMARFELEYEGDFAELTSLLQSDDADARVQALLVLSKRSEALQVAELQPLLYDPDHRVRRVALYYIGTRQVDEMEGPLNGALAKGQITPDLFEAYLAAIQNIQPDFIQGYQQKTKKSNSLSRSLPGNFVLKIVENETLDPATRALALPYLDLDKHREMLPELLSAATSQALQLSLISAINIEKNRFEHPAQVGKVLLQVSRNTVNTSRVRAHALAVIPAGTDGVCELSADLMTGIDPVLQYAAVKHLCQCQVDTELEELIDNSEHLVSEVLSVWSRCQDHQRAEVSMDQWTKAVDGDGDPLRGALVFNAALAMCQTCHRVDGWGGSFGPDLSKIGTSKNRQQLINAILFPSMEMAPEWQGWYVIDEDGNRHVGRQIDVHLKHVELMGIDGNFVSYPQPKSFGVAEKSVMPEGLQNSMTLNEFNDLIAYLESLQ